MKHLREVTIMRNLTEKFMAHIRVVLAASLCMALPAASWANISNTATATYDDAASNVYSASSLAVVTVTPPVISGATTLSGNVGVALTPYTITASNTPTSYAETGTLPTG